MGVELVDRGAYLPVPVLAGPLEGRVDLGTFEGGEGDDGASADGGLVLEGRDYRLRRSGIAERSERSEGRLAASGVLVTASNVAQGVERVDVAEFSQGEAGRLADEGVRVREESAYEGEEVVVGLLAGEPLEGVAAGPRGGIRHGTRPLVVSHVATRREDATREDAGALVGRDQKTPDPLEIDGVEMACREEVVAVALR